MPPEAQDRIQVRLAGQNDLEAIRSVYNQAIAEGIATLETAPYGPDDIRAWWKEHDERYAVVVAETPTAKLCGWASLNRFSHRCAHGAIADLSVYVERNHRGAGVGRALLEELEKRARPRFRKIVLHALEENAAGKRLYAACGFREVGIFKDHGEVEGRLVDVVAMEKLL